MLKSCRMYMSTQIPPVTSPVKPEPWNNFWNIFPNWKTYPGKNHIWVTDWLSLSWISFALHVSDHVVFQDINHHTDEAEVSKAHISNTICLAFLPRSVNINNSELLIFVMCSIISHQLFVVLTVTCINPSVHSLTFWRPCDASFVSFTAEDEVRF